MYFMAKLRKQGTKSLIITIPSEIVSTLKLVENQITQFSIKDNSNSQNTSKVGGKVEKKAGDHIDSDDLS